MAQGGPDEALGCNLTVDTQQSNHGRDLRVGGFRGQGLARTTYRLSYKTRAIRAWSAHGAPLMSLTWRPPAIGAAAAPTATMTCTQKQAQSRAPRTDVHPLVICLHSGVMRWGLGRLAFAVEGVSWTASALGYELRVSTQGGPFGYVGVWTDELEVSGNATTLELTPTQRVTCWRM